MNKVIHGDCLEILKRATPESIDAIICDPPYELGFMGKKWDSTGIAYNVDLWKDCLRVLKPGGHLLAFGGTRTYHRMAVAIEDAGFEVRDMLEYIYASGFPKSLNCSCRCGGSAVEYIHARCKKIPEHDLRPMQKTDLSETLDIEIEQNESVQSSLLQSSDRQVKVDAHERGDTQEVTNIDRREERELEGRCDILEETRELQTDKIYSLSERISSNGEEGRIHNGTSSDNGNTLTETPKEGGSGTSHKSRPARQQDRKSNAVSEQSGTQTLRREKCEKCGKIKNFQGMGSALKPAHEPIIMARKPLSEKTIVENVLKHGTGALDIDGCRIPINDLTQEQIKRKYTGNNEGNGSVTNNFGIKERMTNEGCLEGRFPANIICTDDALNDGMITGSMNNKPIQGKANTDYGFGNCNGDRICQRVADVGSKSRYFNIDVWAEKHGLLQFPKASKRERNDGCEWLEAKNNMRVNAPRKNEEEKTSTLMNNNHPTVKPVHLMSWLVRLVSKEGDTVLDPFAGSGTTGVACKQLNRRFIGIEREQEYINIINARLGISNN